MYARRIKRAHRVSTIRPSNSIASLALVAATLFVRDSAALSSPEQADDSVHTALQLDANAARGEKLYREHCARCHYETAAGDPGNLVPKLAGQRKAYLVKQLADFADVARDGNEMHSVLANPVLREPQVWADLTTYLSNLSVTQEAETGNGESLQLGEAIFQKQCAACHDKDAQGDAEGFVPSLRNQHYSYLIWQMRSVAASRRLHVHPDVAKILGGVGPDEIAAMADYLSRMQSPPRIFLKSGGNSPARK
jgi:cytochrome c553